MSQVRISRGARVFVAGKELTFTEFLVHTHLIKDFELTDVEGDGGYLVPVHITRPLRKLESMFDRRDRMKRIRKQRRKGRGGQRH